MSTSAGKKKFVFNVYAREFQPANHGRRCLLNASAREFQPENPDRRCPFSASAPVFQPENHDRRCLFLTFSNGFPLTEGQIFTFFTRTYGPCVEDVFVHKPRPVGTVAKPPLFGKVMFKHTIIPDYVMGTNKKVFLVIDGIPVYCKRFVSQKSDRDGHHH